MLLVGTFDGHAGTYRSIQSAVNAARPGDWILVAPGDYHETDDLQSLLRNQHGDFGGVLITKSNIHLRGMDRSTVIVDGTKAGSRHRAAQLPPNRIWGRSARTGRPRVATASSSGGRTT